MVSYEFRPPNLLEVLLFVALAFIIGFGFWIIARTFGFPIEAIQTAADAVSTVFLWLALIWLGIIAIELESIREHIKNIEKRLEKRNK